MVKTNFPAVAKRLRSAVKKNLAKELKSWEGDPDMIKMFKGDAKDGNRVADLIEKGRMAKALEKMGDMDTSACEEVGTMLAKTSPAFYVKFLEPDGWIEVWHLNDNIKPPSDDPAPKRKAKKSAVSADMAMVVAVTNCDVLDDIVDAIKGVRKSIRSYDVGYSKDHFQWGVIYTGRLKAREFIELCVAAGYVEHDED